MKPHVTSSRLRRSVTILLLSGAVFMTSCDPSVVQSVLAERGVSVTVEQAQTIAEQARTQGVSDAEVMAATINPKLVCIRSSESAVGDLDWDPYHMRGAHHMDKYAGSGANLPNSLGSSARGPYQWMPISWPAAARTNGFPQWAKVPVQDVPERVQHAVTLRYVLASGTGPWRPDDC